MPRQLGGRSQDGGGAEGFGFLQRGFSSGIRSARLRGCLLGSPPPLLAELVAGSSGFHKTLGPLGHRLSARRENRPIPLAEKGKSACGADSACCTRVCARGVRSSRRSLVATGRLCSARPAERAGAWDPGSRHRPPRPPRLETLLGSHG